MIEVAQKFPGASSAGAWVESVLWKDVCKCSKCGTYDTYVVKRNSNGMPYQYRACRYFFVNAGAVMHGSKLSLQKWGWAISLGSTNLKSVSNMKLHWDLDISQPSVWYVQHWIQEKLAHMIGEASEGPVEVDQTYIGGLEKNKHEGKKSGVWRLKIGEPAGGSVGGVEYVFNQMTK